MNEFNIIGLIYQVADPNSKIKCDNLPIDTIIKLYPFDIYNKCKFDKDTILNYIESLPDSDFKKTYLKFFNNPETSNNDIALLIISDVSSSYKSLLSNYLESKNNFYSSLNDSLSNDSKYLWELQSNTLDLDKTNNTLNDNISILSNTLSKLPYQDSESLNKSSYFNELKDTTKDNMELTNTAFYMTNLKKIILILILR